MLTSNTCKKLSNKNSLHYSHKKRSGIQYHAVHDHQDMLKRKNEIKRKNLAKLRAICIFSFVSSLLFFICYRQVYIYTQGVEIQTRSAELKKYNDDIVQLQLEIERNVDLKKIEKYTMDELGMVKPEKYQIVYISPDTEDEMIHVKSDDSFFSKSLSDFIVSLRYMFGF